MLETQIENLYSSLKHFAISDSLICFLEHLQKDCNFKQNTILAYGRDLKTFAKFCKAKKLDNVKQIDQKQLKEFLLQFLNNSKKSDASAYRSFISITNYFKYAGWGQFQSRDFGIFFSSPSCWRKTPRIYSEEVINKILNAPRRSDVYFLRDKLVLALFYATGLRASDIANLQVADFDLINGIFQAKPDDAKIQLSSPVLTSLSEYLNQSRPTIENENSGKHLLLSRTGRRLGRIELWRIIKKYAQRTGLSKYFNTDSLHHSSIADFGK